MTDLSASLGGVSMELAGAQLAAAFGPCAHSEVVPVLRAIDDELAAWLCPDCEMQLPVDWKPLSPASAAARTLIAAEYAPEVAVELTALYREPEHDHAASECPVKVDVTKLSDPEPQYVHGNCERSTTP